MGMGHSNVYIRKDNESKWAAIPDKSNWVNERLEKDVDSAVKGPEFRKRDPKAFKELKKSLDTRDAPITYKKGGWGA
jgi:hypothetical protein